MKIIGISGSPRDMNTNYMLSTVLGATTEEHELILLKDKNINPCDACGSCYKKPFKCNVDDYMQELYEKLPKADAIVLGSPTYFDDVTGIMKNFFDRCLPFYLNKKLAGKKTALVTVGDYRHGELLKGNPEPKEILELSSVLNCLKSMELFCQYLDLDLKGTVYAIRGNPREKKKEKELVTLGKLLTLRYIF